MRKTIGRSTNFVQPDPPPQPGGTLIFERRFAAVNETKNEVLDALLAKLQSSGAIQSDNDEVRMRLCLDEALVNAVMHGSKYDASKNVTVRAYLAVDKWTVLVEDEGAGFREEDLPDPDAQENLLEESGRGVHLIRTMMDAVSYWNSGRALLMIRKR
jgi:serine/threonine-protein kinase RsbW